MHSRLIDSSAAHADWTVPRALVEVHRLGLDGSDIERSAAIGGRDLVVSNMVQAARVRGVGMALVLVALVDAALVAVRRLRGDREAEILLRAARAHVTGEAPVETVDRLTVPLEDRHDEASVLATSIAILVTTPAPNPIALDRNAGEILRVLGSELGARGGRAVAEVLGLLAQRLAERDDPPREAEAQVA